MIQFEVAKEDESALENIDCLFSLDDIDQALNHIAEKLNQRFSGQPLLVLNVLQGGTLTTASLMTKLHSVLMLDSVYASRYRNQIEGDTLEWRQYPAQDLRDKTILLVDDIYDEGITLSQIKTYCLEKGASEVVTVVLLNKLHDRKVSAFEPDYIALDIPDRYVFGFGLDYYGRYRNAPGIFAIDN